MTDAERAHVLANPMVKATYFSKYFSYWWLNDLFRKGNKRSLEDSDVYHILPDDEAEGLANKLDRLWTKEYKEAHSNNRRPRLRNAFIKFLGFQYALQGGYPFVEEALRIGSPLLIGRLLSFFSPKPGISRLDAYITAFVLCLLIFVQSMLHAPNFFKNTRSGMRLKIAAGSLIYRKALRLSHASLAKTTTGQIVNLVTSDVQKLEQVTVFFHYIWLSPLLVTVVAFLSWRELGPSVLPGVFLLVCLAPLNWWLGKFFARLRFKTAALTDGRIKVMNEIIAGMRVIKMYTWEKPFAILVAGLRRKETRTVKRTSFLRCINAALYHSVFGIISFAMFTTYVMTGNTLTAEKLFVVLGLFMSCRYVVTVFFPLAVMYLNESLVSEKRLQEFLLLDEREQSLTTRERSGGNEDAPLVQLNHVTAYWDKSLNATLKDVSLEAKPGELHIVVGPVGAGKSSLLMTLLGELPVSEGAMTVQGVVGYASQQAWIFSGTVRENIVFGQQFDEYKYQRVIEACALQKDLELLHSADLTLVGERGVVLSGGQKARLSLARAVYYDADIYLLDDPLSAVDTHVGRELFDKCILTMLKDKICVLVTHQLQYLRDATSIICLQEGRCVGQGSITELSESGVDVRSLISLPESDSDSAIEADHIDIEDMEPRSMTRVSTKSKPEETTQTKPDAMDKDRLTGTVTWKVYFEYWKAGARTPLLILLILLFLGTQALLMVSEWWLAQWADVEETLEFKASLSSNSSTANEDPSQMRKHNILIYCFLVLGTFFTAFVAAIVFLFIAVSASQNLHNRMFASILGAPIYFFDTNPVGRVLNRFSKDIGQMDELLPYTFYDYCKLMLMAFAILVLNVVTMPYLLLAAIPLVVLFLYIRNYYLKSAREIKRLEAMNRSPFYSHLSASLQGLTSIRAYSAEARFVHQYHIYQDDHTAPWFLFLTASRWLGSRLDLMCAVFVSFAAFTPLLLAEAGITMSAGIVGLSLTYVRLLIGLFQWCVRQSAEVESLMTSVERVIEYSNLEQELKPHDETLVPPQNWPQYGIITFERLNYTYHHTLPYVLKKVTFCVRAEEKVGVVGRTGAGKSSLMAALFRLAEPEGLVRIDGVPITDVTLHELRSKMSIIPQDPVLFSGSLKKNLDPFNEYGDLELWKALDEVQLKEAVNELPDGLETKLSEGGSNFSVGQRQLVCLARAILKHNKILIIDEATANVDHSTDSLIQETIRTKFKHCTVLTIAHRLNTIMDSDRVLVLDEGKLVEFDEPFLLLQNKNSMFSKMVEHTSKNLATNLYEAAHQAYMLRHETSEDSDTDTRGPSMDELRSSLDACVDRAHVKKQNGGGPEISPPSVARVSCGEKESLLWETSL